MFFVMQIVFIRLSSIPVMEIRREGTEHGNAGKQMKGSAQNDAVINRFCQIMCKQRGEQFNSTTLEIHHSYVVVDDDDDDDDDDDGGEGDAGGDDEM